MNTWNNLPKQISDLKEVIASLQEEVNVLKKQIKNLNK